MYTLKHYISKHMMDFVLHYLRIKKKDTVPVELQRAIDSCTTKEQLTALLFSTTAKDEVVLRAFDKHFEKLEKTA